MNSNLRRSDQGYVYFITDIDREVMKIGFARDVLKRICCLQCGNPRRLDFVGAFKGSETDEEVLHLRLDKYRIVREWFLFAPAMEQLERISGSQKVWRNEDPVRDLDDPRWMPRIASDRVVKAAIQAGII